MGFNFGAELVRLGIVATTSDHKSVVSINLFVALLCACIVIGHLLEENRWMNESITALAIVSSSSPLEKDRFFCFFHKPFGDVGSMLWCFFLLWFRCFLMRDIRVLGTMTGFVHGSCYSAYDKGKELSYTCLQRGFVFYILASSDYIQRWVCLIKFPCPHKPCFIVKFWICAMNV